MPFLTGRLPSGSRPILVYSLPFLISFIILSAPLKFFSLILEGEIANNYDEAHALMIKKGIELGLTPNES